MLIEAQYYNLDKAFEKFTKALRNKTKIRHEQNLLLDKNYRIMYPVIVKWMNYTNAQIIKALNKKYINKSIQKTEVGKIVTKLTDWGKLEKDGIMMVKPATLEIFETGGNEAFKIAGIGGAFDVVNIEAVNIVNEICSKDIKDILDNTKKSINTLIKTGIKEGQAMGKIAKQIRPLVGLTERQSLAVVHYREKLLAKFPKYNVAKLDKMAKKYSDKLHRYRAEMIARTETARAQSEGTLQGYKQLGYKKVEWSANADACSRCMALAGHRFPLQEASGMLPLHPSCRCSWLSVIEGIKPKVPRVPMFIPAKSIGEAEKFAERFANKISYKDLDLKTVNIVNKNFDEIYKKYNLGRLGEIRTEKTGSLAYYQINGRQFTLSTNLTEKKFLNDYFVKYKEGFFAGGKNIKNTADMLSVTTNHESVHVMFDLFAYGDKELMSNLKKIKAGYLRATNAAYKSGNMKLYNSLKISDYARTDLDEFIAEAFTDYKFNKNYSIYSKRVYEAMKKRFVK